MSTVIPPRKKLKLSDLTDDTEKRDNEIQQLITHVQNCQDQLDEIGDKEDLEKSQVDEKFRDLKQLVYDRRDGIIQKIPDFWVKCFHNHPRLSSLVDRKNLEYLKYLTKFRVEDADNSKIAFMISFFFKDNPYFENQVLSKEFTLEDGEYVSTCSAIRWKQGMGVKESSRKRSPEENGFMEWFLNNQNPSPEFPGILYFLWLRPVPIFLGRGADDDTDGLSLLLDGGDDDSSDGED